MSQPSVPAAPHANANPNDEPLDDAVEAVVPYIPFVIPAVGGIMIFLLAMIAVTMG